MKGSSILKLFLMLLAAVFIINQLISSLYSPVKTESAVFFTASDGLDITGIIIRNETLVEYDGNGVMHYLISDGSRVSNGGVIANVYTDEATSISVTKADSIKKQISELEDILGYNDIEAANLDVINQKIDQKVNEALLSASTGDFNEMEYYSDQLLTSFWRRQAATNNTAAFTAQLEALKAQLPTIDSAPKSRVLAAKSGYFVSKTDGYETVFKTENIGEITPEFLKGIKAQEYSASTIGKIVSDYEWYIAAEVSINESLNYKEGEELRIKTALKASPELSVKVAKINISDTDASAVVIFSCNEMNSELASMRSGPMTVIKAEYSGLKVPRKALRVVDSVRGVYVLTGMQISFVPVDIIYSNDSYILCKKITDNEKNLKLYDKVVVRGKNLYDGKIVG
ncbi:MAG: hypothetical protein E7560_01660 [Ruminococcaceae bacterium]|nr:hypothetical protein [Oscillospiraceae bacterium]